MGDGVDALTGDDWQIIRRALSYFYSTCNEGPYAERVKAVLEKVAKGGLV